MTMLTLYRTSKIGDCLAEALDEMITQDKIPGDLGMKVMAEVSSSRSSHNRICPELEPDLS